MVFLANIYLFLSINTDDSCTLYTATVIGYQRHPTSAYPPLGIPVAGVCCGVGVC